MTTRSARPRSVRATTLWPTRVTVRWARVRSAASTASAIACSFRLTDSMFDQLLGEGDGIGVRSR